MTNDSTIESNSNTKKKGLEKCVFFFAEILVRKNDFLQCLFVHWNCKEILVVSLKFSDEFRWYIRCKAC